MKKASIHILGIILFVLSTGCSKVYRIECDSLLLAPIVKELNTPEYITDCRIEIQTSDDFNIERYEDISKISELWKYDYSYVSDNSSVLHIPGGKGKLTIYFSESDEMMFTKL